MTELTALYQTHLAERQRTTEAALAETFLDPRFSQIVLDF